VVFFEHDYVVGVVGYEADDAIKPDDGREFSYVTITLGAVRRGGRWICQLELLYSNNRESFSPDDVRSICDLPVPPDMNEHQCWEMLTTVIRSVASKYGLPSEPHRFHELPVFGSMEKMNLAISTSTSQMFRAMVIGKHDRN